MADLLPECDVPARRRVPDELIAQCLIRTVNDDLDDSVRAIAVQTCWMRGGPAAAAAEWLITTPSSFQDDLVRLVSGTRMADSGRLTRSDHVVGACYVVAVKDLPNELRHRAAVTLVSLCHEAGYAEARRLLPKNGWSWLVGALREGWAGLVALEFIGDQTAPLKTKAAVAVEFVKNARAAVFPAEVDELIRSPKAASVDRLQLAIAVTQRVPDQGAAFLTALATDRTLQPLHRVQAGEELIKVDRDTAEKILQVLVVDRALPPAARELARRTLDGHSYGRLG